eukprot:409952-Amphidinium_carterae.1
MAVKDVPTKQWLRNLKPAMANFSSGVMHYASWTIPHVPLKSPTCASVTRILKTNNLGAPLGFIFRNWCWLPPTSYNILRASSTTHSDIDVVFSLKSLNQASA